MSRYFEFVSQELLIKLDQIKFYIKKHNPTIGVLTEEVVRGFLKNHLPSLVGVEQGFIANTSGGLSKQCDIIVYDSQSFAPLYRVNDIVVVPSESVIAVIEVKTTINKSIFHGVIDYFGSFDYLPNAKTYLFIFNSGRMDKIGDYFTSYKHKGSYQSFDHDTFRCLPDEITGINDSYHFRKAYVITDADMVGYDSWFYVDGEGSDISALQLFFTSIHSHVASYIQKTYRNTKFSDHIERENLNTQSIVAIELFHM